MKNYLSLVPIEAKVHRKQNLLTIFCIALAVFLVTGVFSMADMAVRMEDQRLKEKHGYWHISVQDVSEDTIEQMKKEPQIKVIATYDVVNYHFEKEYRIQNRPVTIAAADENFDDIVSLDMLEGTFLQNSSQIILTRNAKELLDLQLGEKITLQTPVCEMEYTIAGFMENTTNLLANDAIGAFISLEALEEICTKNQEEQHSVYYICFRDGIGLKHHIQTFQEKYGLTKENFGENAAILGIRGISDNSYFVGLYGAACFLVLLVLMAGVLMIAGSMNSNIAERTRFFGMLRCIGASKQQIMHIVRREALNWCKFAIPMGEVLAVLGTWGICAFLRFRIGGEFAGIPTGKVSMIGILCGAMVGIITVLLAAHAPAKRASKVSPMAAVTGNSNEMKKVHSAARTKLWKIDTALGIHHATASGKNLILMTGSFALSIVLFLSFSVMIDWVGHALNTLKPYTSDVTVADASYENTISRDIAEQMGSISEVKNVYGRMYQSLPVETDKDVNQIDLISYEEKQFAWSEEELLCGDISKVSEQSGYVMTVFEKGSPFELGDTLVINGKEVKVAAILSDSPFSSTDIPTVICSEDTFYQITGKNEYALIDMQLTKEADDETVSQIRALLDDTYKVRDARASNREVNSTYYAFSFLVYSFLALIAMITIFHIMNSISMSVSARINQCGMMRAVGMDERQLIRMIAGEALTYGICGCMAGCAIGLPVNRFFYTKFITNYWGTPWYIPGVALSIIIGLTLLSAAFSVYRPAKRIREMTITDTIHAL